MVPSAPMHTLTLGIIAGLATAFFSALSYLVSRHHGNKDGGGSLRLLVFAHVMMGIACLPLAWLLCPDPLPPAGAWLPPLAGSALTYLLGQAAVFAALKQIDASQLAPLLGLKIAVIAVLATCVLSQPLSGQQWLAVAISGVAVAMLQRSGRPAHAVAPWTVLGAVIAICLCFAVSDLFIIALIDAVQGSGAVAGVPATSNASRLQAGGFAMAATYVLCGLIALPFVSRAARGCSGGWGAASQYAAAWLASMAGLYICFGLVGPVFGNILQSTRGIMAVGLGAALASLGWHDLEQPVDRQTLVRRVVAAVMMTAAIACYAA
jgi:drug/metabolite transporter (DMT)-like permease